MISAIFSRINLQGWLGIAVALPLAGLLVLEKWEHRETLATLSSVRTELVAAQGSLINYQMAAQEARRRDAENKARAEAEQRLNNERTRRTYEARIARARADAQRLRDELNSRTNPRRPGAAPVSDDPGSRLPTSETADDHGLSIEERLVATEQAIQLDALIDWVEGLLEVDLDGR